MYSKNFGDSSFSRCLVFIAGFFFFQGGFWFLFNYFFKSSLFICIGFLVFGVVFCRSSYEWRLLLQLGRGFIVGRVVGSFYYKMYQYYFFILIVFSQCLEFYYWFLNFLEFFLFNVNILEGRLFYISEFIFMNIKYVLAIVCGVFY